MERDWERLGSAIETAREAQHLTQVGLAEKAGVSESTIQNFESGVERKRIPTTLSKVEHALGWRAGSGEGVLAGGDPTPAAPDAPVTTEASGLPLRIVQELNDGPLLDTTVLDLTEDGSARMIVVVRGTADASADQIRKDLLAWARTQRLIQRGIDSGDVSSEARPD